MKILALEKEVPGVDPNRFRVFYKVEAMRVWELYQSGIVREMYFREDSHTAVLVLECSSAEEAREVLSSLPLVEQRLIDFEVIPLVAYPGFSRLFSKVTGSLIPDSYG